MLLHSLTLHIKVTSYRLGPYAEEEDVAVRAAHLAVGSPKPSVEDDEGSRRLGVRLLEPCGKIFERGSPDSALGSGGRSSLLLSSHS